MKKIIAFIIMIFAFMAVFGFSFKIFNKKFDDDKPTETDFSTLTYAALGDSITFGELPKQPMTPMEKPYCEIVKDILGLKAVKNYGISGSTVGVIDTPSRGAPMCERYLNMSEADIVSVLGGTNDSGGLPLGLISDTSTSSFYGALKALCVGLKEKYPNSFIFFMTPLKTTDVNRKVSVFRNAIIDVCAKYDIPVLDLYNDCPFEDEMYKDFSDGLHPSQDFHKNVLAPIIADFIKTNYKAA